MARGEIIKTQTATKGSALKTEVHKQVRSELFGIVTTSPHPTPYLPFALASIIVTTRDGSVQQSSLLYKHIFRALKSRTRLQSELYLFYRKQKLNCSEIEQQKNRKGYFFPGFHLLCSFVYDKPGYTGIVISQGTQHPIAQGCRGILREWEIRMVKFA